LVHVGDRILAVDGVKTDNKTSEEVTSLIASNRTSRISLLILPASAAAHTMRQRRLASNGELSCRTVAYLGSKEYADIDWQVRLQTMTYV